MMNLKQSRLRSSRGRHWSIALVSAVSAAIVLAGCSTGAGNDNGQDGMQPHEISIIANWLPQASQGGYWQAAAEDLGKADGITITMKSGGPGIQTVTNVAIGDADYGMTSVDNIYQARAQGIPVVGVFAAFNTSPQCFMSHPSANVKTFTDLNGKKVAVSPAGAFWKIIKNKYDLKPSQELPPVSLTTWNADPDMVAQCFVSEDAYTVEQNGWEANYLMVSDSGYNPYTQVLFTTEDRIREHPEEVRTVVKASQEGWDHLLNGQEGPGVDLMLKENPDYTKGQAEFAIKAMKDMVADPIGSMTAERWQQTYDAMIDAKVLTTKIDWKKGFTTEFLPK